MISSPVRSSPGRQAGSTADVVREVSALREAVSGLSLECEKALKFMRFRNVFCMSVLRGIGYTVGVLLAIAIFIPFGIAFLKSVEWIPLIGDFISRIAAQMEMVQVP